MTHFCVTINYHQRNCMLHQFTLIWILIIKSGDLRQCTWVVNNGHIFNHMHDKYIKKCHIIIVIPIKNQR